MLNPPLRGDCDRCAALCCIAVAFDRSESFAFDKPADMPCGNLDHGHRCTIHGRLAASGFGGCVAFECYGAGQVVTQQMFGGRSWRDHPALLSAMCEAFRQLRRVHELRFLLQEARTLRLGAGEAQRLEGFVRALEPDGGWTPATLRAFQLASVDADIQSFLQSLGSTNRHLRERMKGGPSDIAA